ncbi:hypothetical protein PLESTB_001493800 [Pleodorina starrii]|uniref:Uncharacterized protein n=1 Tax=Pleodorina starrii TaxID=330485 RepID=A0A9W6BWF1_9CHLO|nr:hypothetical protein PLESTB_001493800 [Pleodorina starrii]
MRLLVLSASSGIPYLYQLLQASSGRDDDNGGSEQAAASAAAAGVARPGLRGNSFVGNGGGGAGAASSGGGTTFLGGGVRRLNSSKLSVRGRSRLALRQWHTNSQQWHLAEDVEVEVLLALGIPADWDAETAAHLARGLRDAFVHANRTQLLALAAANGAADAASTLSGGATQPPPPGLAFQPPPGGATPLLTLQALKLLCRLAQEGLDAMTAGGLQPSWLYVAHVDSFMGAQLPASPAARRAAGPGAAGGNSGTAADSGKADRKGKGGLLRGVLGIFRKGSKERGGVSGGGGGAGVVTGAGAGGGVGQEKNGGAAGDASAGEGPAWEPGPVGHLQHLVLPPEGGEAAAAGAMEEDDEIEEVDPRPRRRRGAAPQHRWDPSSIATALWQVRPPPAAAAGSQRPPSPPGRGGELDDNDGGVGAGACGAPHYSFPELEDVELMMEVQLGGAQTRPRRFSVVGVRLRHVVAVVAQLAPAAHNGDEGDDPQPPPAGSISLVRSLLRPSLVPLSSLFRYLARWAPQDEVAAHGLLLRLLE